ncbi:MAG: hypothetical protein ACR2PF_02560, partial [Rhizobiaceae bacterium]
GNHPLAIARIATVLDLSENLGWLEPGGYVDSPRATFDELSKFHTPDYIRTIVAEENAKVVSKTAREHYNLGTMENPMFKGLYERASTSVGGSIEAARRAASGGIAYHPSGGTHHGRPGRASGFCYFNDPVFAILTFLDLGLERVLYADLDAHHGDGVQDAFEHDQRVFAISVHERNRWPYTGTVEDRGGHAARNLPVPGRFNDSEMDYVIEQAVLPLARRFDPRAVVITCGADALHGDPLSSMDLSNICLIRAVEALTGIAPSTVILGGGGYNPWTVSRCWTGIWGMLNGLDPPDKLPAGCREILSALECDLVDEEDVLPHWVSSLVDPENPGEIRDEVKKIVEQVMVD